MCKCTPAGHEVHRFFAGRVRFGGIFRRSLRATTKKRSSTFWQEKVHPRRQNPGYAYESGLVTCEQQASFRLLLPHTVVTGFMPSPSLHAVFVWMMNLFVRQWVCGWGAMFAFLMRAFVALRLMPVARMPSFAIGHLAESPDIRL